MYGAAGQGTRGRGRGSRPPSPHVSGTGRRRHVPAVLGNAPLCPSSPPPPPCTLSLSHLSLSLSSLSLSLILSLSLSLSLSVAAPGACPAQPAPRPVRAPGGAAGRAAAGRARSLEPALAPTARQGRPPCPERLTAGGRAEGAWAGRRHGQAPSRPDHVPQAARHRCAPRRGGFFEARLHPPQLMADDVLLCWCSYRAALRKMYALARIGLGWITTQNRTPSCHTQPSTSEGP